MSKGGGETPWGNLSPNERPSSWAPVEPRPPSHSRACEIGVQQPCSQCLMRPQTLFTVLPPLHLPQSWSLTWVLRLPQTFSHCDQSAGLWIIHQGASFRPCFPQWSPGENFKGADAQTLKMNPYKRSGYLHFVSFPGYLIARGGVGTFVNLIQKKSPFWVRTPRTGEGDEVVPAHTARQWFPDLLTLSMTWGCPLLCLPSRALSVDEGRWGEDRRMVSLRAWGLIFLGLNHV